MRASNPVTLQLLLSTASLTRGDISGQRPNKVADLIFAPENVPDLNQAAAIPPCCVTQGRSVPLSEPWLCKMGQQDYLEGSREDKVR